MTNLATLINRIESTLAESSDSAVSKAMDMLAKRVKAAGYEQLPSAGGPHPFGIRFNVNMRNAKLFLSNISATVVSFDKPIHSSTIPFEVQGIPNTVFGLRGGGTVVVLKAGDSYMGEEALGEESEPAPALVELGKALQKKGFEVSFKPKDMLGQVKSGVINVSKRVEGKTLPVGIKSDDLKAAGMTITATSGKMTHFTHSRINTAGGEPVTFVLMPGGFVINKKAMPAGEADL